MLTVAGVASRLQSLLAGSHSTKQGKPKNRGCEEPASDGFSHSMRLKHSKIEPRIRSFFGIIRGSSVLGACVFRSKLKVEVISPKANTN